MLITKVLFCFVASCFILVNSVFAVEQGLYIINPIKDSGGEILHQVKIYVDDAYTHHVDDETLTFCNGCHCDDDKLVDCEFGEHTIKLEKTGYLDWIETITVSPGDSQAVDPVMVVPAPTPTDTPTPSPTAIPEIQKAIYKINEVKNSDNDILSSVKIFVDGNYINHYAPEILTFCDGCRCDPDNNVNCELGNHRISLEKTNYQTWGVTKNFTSGFNEEVNPVLDVVVPTSTPTPVPAPTSTLVPSPTSTLSPTPSKKLTLTPTATVSGEILGQNASGEGEVSALGSVSGAMEASGGAKLSKPSITSFIYYILTIGGGVGLISASIYFFLKNRKTVETL